MITLKHDVLVFRFPEVHRDAELRLDFQRTLRIPDDEGTYALPPGLGRFPLRHVDDYAQRVPAPWRDRGGVMLPIYQAEALWINFRGNNYPMLVRIAAGKINAVTGEPWNDALERRERQDYLVVPTQPWLDGYCTDTGVIRQFVALPLGSGYTPEEQLTGAAEFGGIQIRAHPLRREAWERILEQQRRRWSALRIGGRGPGDDARFRKIGMSLAQASPDMGLAMGGRMRQEIFGDRYDFDDWDRSVSSRCFVHLANSLVWRTITGREPPTVPPTAAEYTQAGLPWFDYYAEDERVLGGSPALGGLQSITQKAQQKGDAPLPENEPVEPKNVIGIHAPRADGVVREGVF